MCDAPNGSLHSNDFTAFEQDSALDDARDFLTALIRQDRSAALNELSVKILVRLGLVRSNPEDFLVVVNLLNQNPKLVCDLRDEIHSMQVRKHKSGDSDKQDKFDSKLADFKKIAELGNLAPSFMKEVKEDLSGERWTTDGEFFFAPNPNLHKFNIPRDASENMFCIDKNPEVSYDAEASLCYLDGKLYVLTKSSDEPLVVFDPSTLKKDDKATEAIKWPEEDNAISMRTTEEPDKETGRKMQSSPLFTDGVHLYCCSMRVTKGPAQEDEDGESKEVEKAVAVLEKYCTKEWKCLKQTPLYKNKFLDLFSKAAPSEVNTFLQKACFAIASSHLYYTYEGVEYIMDISGENGFVVHRTAENKRFAHVIHDLRNKKLFSFNVDDDKNKFLYEFSAPIFKTQIASTETSATPVESIRQQYLDGFKHQVRPNMIERKFKQIKPTKVD